jgi:predicted polyphosphate/ATP-dependent NAD kinase
MTNGTPDLLPRPDPTDRTTDQLNRAIANLKALIETRLDGMDIATQLLSGTVNRVPSDVDTQVGHLKELHAEKFRSVEQMITQRFLDNKLAVDAAFAAAKEAVAEQNKSSALAIAKSESTTVKQIDQLQVLIQTTNKAIDEKIDDLKARQDQGAGRTGGVTDSRTMVFAVLTLLVSTAVAVAVIIGLHL